MDEETLTEYTLKFDELNKLGQALIDTIDRNASKEKQTEYAVDSILSFLIDAYLLGFGHTSRMLDIEEQVSVDKMNDAIYEQIQGETFEDRVRTHIDNEDMNALYLLIGDEYHRVYSIGAEDSAQMTADKGYSVFKTWVTVGDDKVRDTHRYIDMQTISIDSEFYTYDGDHASRPGGFTLAQNNCGCRCVLAYSRI
jgi:microcompartment protein CcmK/EutM